MKATASLQFSLYHIIKLIMNEGATQNWYKMGTAVYVPNAIFRLGQQLFLARNFSQFYQNKTDIATHNIIVYTFKIIVRS